MKTVAFLPIKLNSQRLPHKNTLIIAGHPLCWHLSKSLCEVEEIDEVYVFCSNELVMEYVPDRVRFLKRDEYYDGDSVKSFELIEKFISEINADIYVFGNTTSPFLKPESIDNAVRKVKYEEYDSALTVEEFKTFAIYKGEPINYDVNDIPKTQDIEPVFVETSGIYVFERDVFFKHRRRVGFNPYYQIVKGLEAVDIDTKEDFILANQLYYATLNMNYSC